MDSSSWLASVRPRSRSRKARLDRYARSQGMDQQVGHPAQQVGDRAGLRIETLLAGEGKHPLGQVGAALGGLQGVLQEVGGTLVAGQAFLQQPEAADDHRQQVVEVVGHAAGEVPQGLHLLGLEQLLAGPFQFAFGFDPVGDVTGYLGEADQPAIAVADRIDHHVGPEATAVLAHPPAFLLETPFAFGGGQAAGRLAGLAVFGGVEAGEVPADHLFRQVALDPLGAEVPVGDPPAVVEHVDGVVGNALHQQAELLLAAPQRLLGRAPFAEVVDQLGEAEQLALAVADGVDHHLRPEALAVAAHPPALGLEAALGIRLAQRLLRNAGVAVLAGVKAGVVAAEDLARVVAEQARAGAPAGDTASAVQGVDRVVVDRFVEQAVARGLVQGLSVFGFHGRVHSSAARPGLQGTPSKVVRRTSSGRSLARPRNLADLSEDPGAAGEFHSPEPCPEYGFRYAGRDISFPPHRPRSSHAQSGNRNPEAGDIPSHDSLSQALIAAALQRQIEVSALQADLNSLQARPGLRCKPASLASSSRSARRLPVSTCCSRRCPTTPPKPCRRSAPR